MLLRMIYLSVFFMVPAIAVIGAEPVKKKPVPPGRQMVNRYQADEKKLVTALSNPKLWEEAGPPYRSQKPKPRKAELLNYLEAAGMMRSNAVIPALVPNIAFNPTEGVDFRMLRREKRYPAYGALKKIGFVAIPALLDRLQKWEYNPNEKKLTEDEFLKKEIKKLGKEIEKLSADELFKKLGKISSDQERQVIEYRLLWKCIVVIYASKDSSADLDGYAYARLRIRQEIQKIKKSNKGGNSPKQMRLERVLKEMRKQETFLRN